MAEAARTRSGNRRPYWLEVIFVVEGFGQRREATTLHPMVTDGTSWTWIAYGTLHLACRTYKVLNIKSTRTEFGRILFYPTNTGLAELEWVKILACVHLCIANKYIKCCVPILLILRTKVCLPQGYLNGLWFDLINFNFHNSSFEISCWI